MAELRAGATVGRFRLEREVARGGMGAVWAARDPGARGRLVAVKTVIAAKSSQKLSQLFVEEARIARAVRHPNLVELYDAGEENGVPYLAMEWVEGLTLRALAQSPGDLPLGVILRICMEACDGLHAVHEARTDDGTPLHIVHRDVSPHNLLVSIAGRVKVIDFGIAKARGRLASETTDGVLRGKVRYMSPEHARGTALDRRADIWSLGVTLLEVATGVTPYAAEHDVATLVQLLSAEPTIPEHPRLPPAVRRVVTRALCRKPEERYPNARAMGTDLEAAIVSLGEKVTRREVAQCVRMRIETARTQALRVPSFESDDDDGAPTELFVMPRPIKAELETKSETPPALPPPTQPPAMRSETETVSAVHPAAALPRLKKITKGEPLPTPVAPPKPDDTRHPPARDVPAQALPSADTSDELSEEDLTNIRPVDVIMSSSIVPGKRSSAPPANGAVPAAEAPLDTRRTDGDTTSRLSSPPPRATATPTPRMLPAPVAAPPAEAHLEPPVVAMPASETSPGWVAAPPPRSPTRVVPILAASLVAVFLVVGALVALGATEPEPPDAPPAAPSAALGPEEAVAIGAVRSAAPVTSPSDAAAPKPKR